MKFDTQEDWIRYGVEKGWCSLPKCATHDALPLSPEEQKEFERGYDPCLLGIRLWEEGQFFDD